eukprot:365634-Chlamydomonas_euryale.AAC.7
MQSAWPAAAPPSARLCGRDGAHDRPQRALERTGARARRCNATWAAVGRVPTAGARHACREETSPRACRGRKNATAASATATAATAASSAVAPAAGAAGAVASVFAGGARVIAAGIGAAAAGAPQESAAAWRQRRERSSSRRRRGRRRCRRCVRRRCGRRWGWVSAGTCLTWGFMGSSCREAAVPRPHATRAVQSVHRSTHRGDPVDGAAAAPAAAGAPAIYV